MPLYLRLFWLIDIKTLNFCCRTTIMRCTKPFLSFNICYKCQCIQTHDWQIQHPDKVHSRRSGKTGSGQTIHVDIVHEMSYSECQRWKTWSWNAGVPQSHTNHTCTGKQTEHTGLDWKSLCETELVPLRACSLTPSPLLFCYVRRTSHWILDPQDASDKVRRLAEHPESLPDTVTFLTCNVRSEHLNQVLTDNHGENRVTSPDPHVIPPAARWAHGRTSPIDNVNFSQRVHNINLSTARLQYPPDNSCQAHWRWLCKRSKRSSVADLLTSGVSSRAQHIYNINRERGCALTRVFMGCDYVPAQWKQALQRSSCALG